jgi:hypothetical protein
VDAGAEKISSVAVSLSSSSSFLRAAPARSDSATVLVGKSIVVTGDRKLALPYVIYITEIISLKTSIFVLSNNIIFII